MWRYYTLYFHTSYILYTHIHTTYTLHCKPIHFFCSYPIQNPIYLYGKPSADWILIIFSRKRYAPNPWWWSMENMRFPRQSVAIAYMNRSHWGPRCLLPLITPHLRQVLCCIFNEMERGATAFIPHLAFLHTAKSSVRDDKLQFGERSSEILTRASSKPSNQLLNDIFINQWDGADRLKDEMLRCRETGILAFGTN